jgi:hypothetical protein
MVRSATTDSTPTGRSITATSLVVVVAGTGGAGAVMRFFRRDRAPGDFGLQALK